jgi:hypothetical protein
MGGWFSKWSRGKENANAKVITDPHIIKQFEHQIYGIELTSISNIKREHPIIQICRNLVI